LLQILDGKIQIRDGKNLIWDKHPGSATLLSDDRSQVPELQVAFFSDEASQIVEHPRLRGGPRHIDEVLGHVVMSKTKGETFPYRFENETKNCFGIVPEFVLLRTECLDLDQNLLSWIK
jgi:glycosyltransferase A (GT-A) superfamily protein (DUF2064 family)